MAADLQGARDLLLPPISALAQFHAGCTFDLAATGSTLELTCAREGGDSVETTVYGPPDADESDIDVARRSWPRIVKAVRAFDPKN